LITEMCARALPHHPLLAVLLLALTATAHACGDDGGPARDAAVSADAGGPLDAAPDSALAGCPTGMHRCGDSCVDDDGRPCPADGGPADAGDGPTADAHADAGDGPVPDVAPDAGDACAQIRAQHQALLAGATSCGGDGDCQVLMDQCGQGLGGCWVTTNRSLTQAQLNALGDAYRNAGCTRAVCACIVAPAARCQQGRCVAPGL
jgi:hypothetical protein